MQTGNLQLVRGINRRLIFDLIRREGSISRAAVAGATALSKATVSDVVEELLRDGLVIEEETAPCTVGRRPILLKLNGDGPCLGAVRILPDRVLGALVDLEGRVLRRVVRACRGRSAIRAAAEVLAAVRGLAAGGGRTMLGAGVGVPGILNRPGDVVLQASALGWRDVSLRRMLENAVDFPVFLGDEGRLASLAAARAGDQADSLFYLGINDTVCTGLVRGGRPAGGTQAGHLALDPQGPPCWCGNRGCLTALMSEDHLWERLAERRPGGRPARRGRGAVLAALHRAARDGDEPARAVLAEAARWIGKALANLVLLYQPEMILLSGWPADEPYLAGIRDELHRCALTSALGPVRIEAVPASEDAVLLGAAVLALEGMFGPCPAEEY